MGADLLFELGWLNIWMRHKNGRHCGEQRPFWESRPSEADIKVTRDLIRGGQLLKIEVIDHVIIGNGNRSSLRELGYFCLNADINGHQTS
jgi:RadC-like JAB domain